MKLKNILVVVCLISIFNGYSQSYPGYFGKKTYIEALTTNGLPIFTNLWGFNGGYENIGGQLYEQDLKWGRPWKWYQFGLSVSAGRAINNNFAVGFEYSRHNWRINGPGGVEEVTQNQTEITMDVDGNELPYPYYATIRHEHIRTTRQTFMPKIELASGDGLLPMGLTHVIGVGLTITSKVEDDYVLGYQEYYGGYITPIPDSVYTTTDLIDYSIKYKGIQFMYGIKMRSPLSKSLFLTYGMRYMINWRIGNGEDLEYGSAEQSIRKYIVRNNLLHLMSFDIGLTVPF